MSSSSPMKIRIMKILSTSSTRSKRACPNRYAKRCGRACPNRYAKRCGRACPKRFGIRQLAEHRCGRG
jgi:hypothetical protein